MQEERHSAIKARGVAHWEAAAHQIVEGQELEDLWSLWDLGSYGTWTYFLETLEPGDRGAWSLETWKPRPGDLGRDTFQPGVLNTLDQTLQTLQT